FTEGTLSENQAVACSLRSQTATISGWKFKLRRWHHRAAALANSLPINPAPMTPNRITRLLISTRSLQNLHCLLSSCTLVNDRHQSGSHTRRIRMLDNISTIDNTGSALLHQLFGTFENFLLGSPPASSDENRYSGSHFNNSVILLDIVTGIGLYDVGTEFNGLSDKRKDLLDRAIYHIT